MDNDELIEETEHHVKIAASQVARRFKGYVTYSDLVQEGYVWVLRHPGTVSQRFDDGKRGEDRLIRQLARYMEKKARAERASSLRYEPDDEAFYAYQLVEACLPAIWDDDMMVHPPSDDANTGSRHRTDQSETSNWLVSVLDIRAAWKNADLDSEWRLALAYRYGEGLRLYQVADILQVSDDTAQEYIDKGIRSLIRELGGSPPYKCPPDCECGVSGPRRAISNAQAQAQLENDYE